MYKVGQQVEREEKRGNLWLGARGKGAPGSNLRRRDQKKTLRMNWIRAAASSQQAKAIISSGKRQEASEPQQARRNAYCPNRCVKVTCIFLSLLEQQLET
jgi:hypothetical protein